MRYSQRKKLWPLAIFAISMAFVESAVVVYLRRVYDISDMVTSLSSFDPTLAAIELGREIATIVMLLTIGWAAGRNVQTRLGFTLYAFGLWDITYYLWLKVIIDWPVSLLDMDLLFLVPLPWWGPVLAPILIAALMTVGGAGMVIFDEHGMNPRFRIIDWGALGGGVLAILYAFMADALALLPADAQALTNLKPTAFEWPIYFLGISLIIYGLFQAISRKELK